MNRPVLLLVDVFGDSEFGGWTYAIEARSVHLGMTRGLESIEYFGTFVKVAGADLFFALAAKGHSTEDDWELGFGRHCDVGLLAVIRPSRREES